LKNKHAGILSPFLACIAGRYACCYVKRTELISKQVFTCRAPGNGDD